MGQTMRQLAAFLLISAALAACGDNNADDDPSVTPTPADAPAIAADMEMPVDTPFCSFIADGPDGADETYVFVTDFGESVYHGYAKLDGEVTRLTEVEAGFGAGMETRRYVDDTESVELEVILLDENVDEAIARYTGSVRVIYPVEGNAVKFYGECVTQ